VSKVQPPLRGLFYRSRSYSLVASIGARLPISVFVLPHMTATDRSTYMDFRVSHVRPSLANYFNYCVDMSRYVNVKYITTRANKYYRHLSLHINSRTFLDNLQIRTRNTTSITSNMHRFFLVHSANDKINELSDATKILI
jgi:hypothetical protein